MNTHKITDSFFANIDKRWTRIKYDEIKFLRAFENDTVIFLTHGRTIIANHLSCEVTKMLSNYTNFVHINRSEIVNVDYIDGFEGNCYYIDENQLYATGDYKTYLKEYFEDVIIHD